MASENDTDIFNNDTNETDVKEAEEIVLPTSKSCKGIIKDPNFAVVCSFIKIFGPLLHFKELSIETLQQFFDCPTQDNQDDIQALFIKLLRRAGWRVIPDKWEKGLLKFVKIFDITIAWDLEQFGFRELSGEAKLAILKHLLESQFDNNDKFKTAVNYELTPFDLRPRPVGSDIDGLIYWFHEDELLQIRLYSTEEDELDCEAWKVLACEIEEIMDVVQYLEKKSENNPKDIAKDKRNERRRQRALKEKEKAKKKKGKKSKKQVSSENSGSDESDGDDDNPCARCYSGVHPEWILLCDKCDAAYHTACLRPPLMSIPDGDWFCPYCSTLLLIDTLKDIYSRISTRIKSRSRKISRQNACGINLSNIRQSGRVRKTVDYTFSEFDQEILEAVDRDGRNTRAAQNSQSITPARVGIRQSKRRRMLYNDSDSDSNYDPGSPMVEPHIPKHPERHVYLRRHENGVEIGNSNDVEKEKQQNVLSEDDRSLSESAALQSDEAVYRGSHGTSLDKNKLTNPASFGATSNQYGECEDVEGSMDTVTEISDCSLVQNNKTSDTTSQSQSNPSVNATIQANESSTSNPIEHNKSTNIGLPNKQDTIPLNLSEDSVTSSNDNTQVNTSTAENICSDDNIINGNEYACAESNSRLLDNRDVNLLKQENEQADLIQKNPDHRYESPTFA